MEFKKLDEKELAELKAYLSKLSELQNEDKCQLLSTWSDEELSKLTPIHSLIEKLGGGDPVKAAIKHKNALDSRDEAIRLTNGDTSKAMH